jgi:aconitate hydratase
VPESLDSLGSRDRLDVGGETYTVYRLDRAMEALGADLDRLPFTHRILLENLLRYEDGLSVDRDQIEAVAHWDAKAEPDTEIAFRPGRVVLQDFTGVPAVVDLAAMRDAMSVMGGDPNKINPLQPVDLVIDHSVQVDVFGVSEAYALNVQREYERNVERYLLLKWAQQAFDGFRVVPPGTGIVHQVNLEYLGQVVWANEEGEAYPDTLVGTDSHTTMINGLGVVGWGVGGIEAEAAMLGQPVAMLIPQVVGVRLSGSLPEGATGTDLVLRVTELLRTLNVVGKFVEFFGEGLSNLPLAARATIANMCPEYGATVGYFPVDGETLNYMRFTGRDEAVIARVEAYSKLQRLFRTDATPEPDYSELVELDLGTIEPSLAGPKRPQDRIALSEAKASAEREIATWVGLGASSEPVEVRDEGSTYPLQNGSVVIAAITSCTNTSNPEVMVAAGLLAKKAVEQGLSTKPWVKTSLAPGSKVVTDYFDAAGLTPYLDELGFTLVGYGCTTCIGNSGPLPEPVEAAVDAGNLAVAAVLSGNRNFEARVHNKVRSNYLASPPLVVAYALAGRTDIDLTSEPIGEGPNGPVYLRDIWPTQAEIADTIRSSVRQEMFRHQYGNVFEGDDRWRALAAPIGDRFEWDPASTYVRRPPFFDNLPPEPGPVSDVRDARVLAVLGDSVTTDHISPAGGIAPGSPAARYLEDNEVTQRDFNQYGARRGNHEVMMRGTFANVRLRNALVEREGGWTVHLPDGEELPIWDAAERYEHEGVPLIVIAGREYGSGSSRDWAAKGPNLQGVKAVIAQSFERIHRSNLVGMGILPLEFEPGDSFEALGLTGRERYDVLGVEGGVQPRQQLTVRVLSDEGEERTFRVRSRIDTPVEAEYYRHGGILQYVLRQLLRS